MLNPPGSEEEDEIMFEDDGWTSDSGMPAKVTGAIGVEGVSNTIPVLPGATVMDVKVLYAGILLEDV